MATKRKPSLAALAKSRGCDTPSVLRQIGGEWRVLCFPCFDVMYAKTRKCAEAGLRAALSALPPVRAKGKR